MGHLNLEFWQYVEQKPRFTPCRIILRWHVMPASPCLQGFGIYGEIQGCCRELHAVDCSFKFSLQNGLYILLDIPVGCL